MPPATVAELEAEAAAVDAASEARESESRLECAARHVLFDEFPVEAEKRLTFDNFFVNISGRNRIFHFICYSIIFQRKSRTP